MNTVSAEIDSLIESNSALWEELRDSRIFITGGTGFVGSWLLESFCRANDVLGLKASALVLSRRPDLFAGKLPHLCRRADINFLAGNVVDFPFPDGKIDYIIHAAAETVGLPQEGSRQRLLEVGMQGTWRVINLARQRQCAKVLFTSSGAVYGQLPGDIAFVAETYAGGPDCLEASSVYAESKRLSELIGAIACQNTDLQFKIARCFAFVGPYLPLDSNFAIGNFIADALGGGPIVIKGDGSPVRSYLYGSDLAVWLWTVLLRGQSLHAYNVGSQEPVSIRKAAEAVNTAVNSNLPVIVEGRPNTFSNPVRYVPDTYRARNELGLKQTVSLAESIARTIAFYRAAKP